MLKEESQGYTTNSTNEVILADETGKQKQRKKRCIYCEGEYWSDECLRYPNIDARRNKLKNRCFISLEETNKTKLCQVPEKPCVHWIENIIIVYAQSFEWRAQ